HPLRGVILQHPVEDIALDAIGLQELADIQHDRTLRVRQPGDGRARADDVDRRCGDAGLAREGHVRVPHVRAVALTASSAYRGSTMLSRWRYSLMSFQRFASAGLCRTTVDGPLIRPRSAAS